MRHNVPDDPQLPPGLLRDLVETFRTHGFRVPPENVLPAMIMVLHGERRSSTELIRTKLVATFQAQLVTEFVLGERHARVDDLNLITGEGHSGILQRAQTAALRSSY